MTGDESLHSAVAYWLVCDCNAENSAENSMENRVENRVPNSTELQVHGIRSNHIGDASQCTQYFFFFYLAHHPLSVCSLDPARAAACSLDALRLFACQLTIAGNSAQRSTISAGRSQADRRTIVTFASIAN